MTKLLRWLPVCAVLVLTACDSLVQEVDPGRLPVVDKKLVVHSFISPQDSVLAVAVGESRPVLGTNPGTRLILTNATVTLSDGSRSITIPYNTQDGAYTTSSRTFPIRAGQTYRLQVSTSDNRRVEAVCTVPRAIPIATALVDSAVSTRLFSNQREMVYYTRLTWQDPAGEANYYRVAGDVSYSIDPTRGTASEPLSFGRSSLLVSDRNQDGQTISSSRGELPVTSQVPTTAVRQYTITAHLLHTEKNYFDYHTTVIRQDQTGGNPFAEPVLISGNIEGGLGCFGAYSRATVTLTLKK
ncbi:hypothetical protein GCM10023189_04600 [Nibrella saemangeumensis]|uniref:DUF4249 domain-containing protein n=1 Tax=Nibrella saemangeumensis TaxID=1084526 RepID=A0ABP8MEI6_9BACT